MLNAPYVLFEPGMNQLVLAVEPYSSAGRCSYRSHFCPVQRRPVKAEVPKWESIFQSQFLPISNWIY